MSRPKLCLCDGIKFDPDVLYFKPSGVLVRDLKVVGLSMEEIEAYRLCYIKNLEQTEASLKMPTSQSTFQRILSSAHKKIADALVNGKAIKITRHNN